MHLYQLDDKKTDQDFLDGRTVSGRAVFKTGGETELRNGDLILVRLSNGKKYKGRITGMSLFTLANYRVGEIGIERVN